MILLYVMINLITFLSLYSYTQAAEYDLRIEGIEPNAGPIYMVNFSLT